MDILERYSNLLKSIQYKYDKNIFKNIKSYKSLLPVSKVILFFSTKNIIFTKTMLQNYVRIGTLPPLIEKRYYNSNHLVLLYFIYILKESYSLDEISILFEKLDFDEDLLNLFNEFVQCQEKLNKIKLEYIEKIMVELDEMENSEAIAKLILMNEANIIKQISVS